jgi:superfamily II DNA or RNA helicase
MNYKAELLLGSNYKIKIKSNHYDYLSDMKEEFAIHVPNYFFMGKYKAGMWDGKSHFITEAGFLPYGLLLDFMRKSIKMFPNVKLVPDDGVKALFKGPAIPIKYDLSLEPRPYQKETIESTIKFTKGIIRSATASGKSLAISYILKNLLDNQNITNVYRGLVVVPSKSLVEQFKGDMIDYGMPEDSIGKVYDKYKEWDNNIVISTWQTLRNNHDKLSMYDCIIGDECHQNKAHELKKIFSKTKARYRLGFTGTLPTHITDMYNIKSYLGPVLKDYPSGLLAEQGYIAQCTVKIHKIKYPHIENKTYRGIKDEVFNDRERLELIGKIVNGVDDNILLLVTYKAEGEKLRQLLGRRTKRKVVFLSGDDKTDTREEWRQRMINEKNIALIATYGIFQQGINIPNLKHGILASPSKSKIRVLQSVGRTLRAHNDETAYIYDIIDECRFLSKHGEKRLDYYESEGFEIEYPSFP